MTKKEQERPRQPVARPGDAPSTQERGNPRAKPADGVREERIGDPPPIELADGDEVERRDESPTHPARATG